MTSKEKIIAYLAYKDISQRKFSLKTGLSEGILRAGKDLGVDKIRTIRENYPDLNMDWVIYDEGDMIVNTLAEPTGAYENTQVEKSLKQFVFDCIEEYFTSQRKEEL